MHIRDEEVITHECKADPDEKKTVFRLRPLSFADLDAAGDKAGTISAKCMFVARMQAAHDEKNKQIEADNEKREKEGLPALPLLPPLQLSEEDNASLQEMGRWVRERNTALVMRGVIGADDIDFSSPLDAERYFKLLQPLAAVRDVIDELSQTLQNLSSPSKKKN